ncbi:DYNC2LI1 [Symbiodinium pilosum]|uniref:Cytoplasmic dynein 2 light intermediate chain 1 n=1 Tax=Symbiodinium pilosum TaxID=2952 RepID=A0A812U5L2_SYMPI|nr:DYNC2LI1 [Symbiodinium pilosum]
MARAKKKEADDFSSSIFSRLTEEHSQRSAGEEFANDVTILFCGSKKSGKTSLVDRFINPTKDEKDQPKPTVALDYKFARYASEGSSSKVLAHIYDLGGDEANENLLGAPVSKATVGNLVLAITLDLSEPHSCIPNLEKWLQLLRSHVDKSLQALAQENPPGLLHVDAQRALRANSYAEHPDRGFINPFPVPLVIFGFALMSHQDVSKAAQSLLDFESNQTVFKLEKSSVYGSAFAFPQIARSSGYKSVFVTLWIRAYMALALNYLVQLSLVMFVGEATQIMAPLGGQMHLCDFGADLDMCKGPDADFQPRCTGPGGTQFAPPRLYGYTQWAVQKFTKQALLDVIPDQEKVIEEKVDPGEYGLENHSCRWLCLFLFVLSVNHEIQVCFRMLAMLWYLPSSPDKCNWLEVTKGEPVYRIAGMPCHWKIITGILVFIPKLALCYFVLLEGTLLLMDTSGILDTVLGAMSMAFILDVDEMLHDSMITHAGRHVIENIKGLKEDREQGALGLVNMFDSTFACIRFLLLLLLVVVLLLVEATQRGGEGASRS